MDIMMSNEWMNEKLSKKVSVNIYGPLLVYLIWIFDVLKPFSYNIFDAFFIFSFSTAAHQDFI